MVCGMSVLAGSRSLQIGGSAVLQASEMVLEQARALAADELEASMEDIVVAPDRSVVHGWGHYHETYRIIDGQWRFATVHLTRLRLEYSQL